MENNENTPSENIQTNEKSKSKNKKPLIIVLILIVIIAIVGGIVLFLGKDKKEEKSKTTLKKSVESEYKILGNDLDNFDLFFMKQNNTKSNKVYSPLSIKASLAMLKEGAGGNSKDQITAVIGDYKLKKYPNNDNMSFANAMFINDSHKESIKSNYIDALKNKYNAEVKYDSFSTPNTVNKWIEEKTFGKVKNLADDISANTFVQVNALAIDMEWVNHFQKKSAKPTYSVSFPHQEFYNGVSGLFGDMDGVDFNNEYEAESGEFAGVVNRYNIVEELGEDNIRKTVGDEYKAWLEEDPCGTASSDPDVNTYLDNYIKELKEGYKHVSTSTDYKFYDNETIKAFSKDLKTYDNITLQYVAIMPKKKSLDTFISENDAKSITNIIKSLKEVKLENFNDKVITKITGNMPFFNFEYELQLINELKKVGITDIFDLSKANLSGITKTNGLYIDKMIHKANIELTNEGIKAAAATMAGGLGAADCRFDHIYNVPIEEINLDFDKPFMYLIRDKDTGEIWFTGTVYEPNKFDSTKRGY